MDKTIRGRRSRSTTTGIATLTSGFDNKSANLVEGVGPLQQGLRQDSEDNSTPFSYFGRRSRSTTTGIATGRFTLRVANFNISRRSRSTTTGIATRLPLCT